jgi:uncharacterized phage protein (TIGR01671 family)
MKDRKQIIKAQEKREIKFRAWDNKFKCMRGLKITDLFSIRSDGEVNTNNNDEMILMQFTGLKDKNGKEIYEGDIVLVENKGDVEIIFDYGAFGFYYDGGFDFLSSEYDEENEMEVIGNIYESPELLEVKQ